MNKYWVASLIQTVGFSGVEAEPFVDDSKPAEAGDVPRGEVVRRRRGASTRSQTERTMTNVQVQITHTRCERGRTLNQRNPVTFLCNKHPSVPSYGINKATKMTWTEISAGITSFHFIDTDHEVVVVTEFAQGELFHKVNVAFGTSFTC